jgi:hypothetical protein
MKIFYKADRIMSDGEIVIVGRIYKDDVLPTDPIDQTNKAMQAHGETVRCAEEHKHGLDCAKAALATVKPSMEAYFAAWDALPEDAVHVEMPQKEVTVKEDGKTKTKMVDDRDL